MNIAICDDEVTALKETNNMVKKVLDDMNINYSIDEFTNLDDIINSKKIYTVIFIDVEFGNSLNDKNGVWGAKILKNNNPNAIIIFVTNYEEYIDEVIEKYAYRYWSKPIDEYRLRKSIYAITEKIKAINIEEYETKEQKEIALKNIIYITPYKKHCKIVTTSGEYLCSDNFKTIREKISFKNFCDSHGSFCVNLDYVEKYTKTDVFLKYNQQSYSVYMSRRYYKNFKEMMYIAGGDFV